MKKRYIVIFMMMLFFCSNKVYAVQGEWQEAKLIQDGNFTIVKKHYKVGMSTVFRMNNRSISVDQKESIIEEAYYNEELSVRKEACANAIFQAMISKSSAINIYPYALNSEQVTQVYSDVINTHPELFYAKRGFYQTSIEMDNLNDTFVDSISGFYKYENGEGLPDLATINTMSETLSSKATSILEQLKLDGLSDIEKTIIIHDYIVAHTSYDYDSELQYGQNASLYPDEDFTVYGALVNEKAVCQGYSLAFKYLTGLAGIGNTGFATNSYHMWNTISINGANYYVDCTWDDGAGYDSYGFVSHIYLLKGNVTFSDHDNIDSDRVVPASAYEDCYWDKVFTKICRYGKDYYYLQNGNIYQTSQPTKAGTLVFDTGAVSSREWSYRCMAMDCKNSFLFYNLVDSVYSYNIKSKQSTLVGTIAKSDIKDAHGLYLKGNTLRISTKETSTTPSSLPQTAQSKTFDDNFFRNLVTDIEVEDVTIKMAYKNGKMTNTSHTLQLAVVPEYADNKEVSYSVKDTSIVQITKDGVLTAIKSGTTTLTITSKDGNMTKTINITVLYEEKGTDAAGNTVYLKDGEVLTNQYVNDTYVGADGLPAMGVVEVNGEKYLFIDGKVAGAGWQTVNGIEYYIKSNGTITTGWKTIKKKKYYFTSDGKKVTGFYKIGKKTYYFNSKGQMKTGFVKVKKKTYYMNSKGVMQTGFVKIKKKTYYFDSKGRMQTGFVKVKKKTYYMNSKGIMQTGWKTIKGHKYYFDKKGVMYTGRKKIKGKYYNFSSKGRLK